MLLNADSFRFGKSSTTFPDVESSERNDTRGHGGDVLLSRKLKAVARVPNRGDDRIRGNRNFQASSLVSAPEYGVRRTSVALRLEEQGLRPTSRNSETYAVQSIQRGNEEWKKLLRPFVADLALRSIVKRHSHQRGVTFRPYHCQAAVLFVDLSGYSQITSAIAHRGAHTISDIVNAYMERLLSVIYEHGGDVVKFAGDALVVLWEGTLQKLELNVFCAARCALELQVQAASHNVEGTNLMFRIHCG